jgi:hypothetical protein
MPARSFAPLAAARRYEPPTAVGAIVMATGIFIAASLPHLPGGMALTRPIAILLMLTWLTAAVLLVLSARRRGLSAHTGPVVTSFAIGTWVAGTAIAARVAMFAAPASLWLPRGLFFLALALWLGFIPSATLNLARIAGNPLHRPTGLILLSAVATQAVALMAFRLFPAATVARSAGVILLAAGIGFYLAGVWLVLRRYLRDRDWSLARDWDNANCILHGALSITGLAAVVSDVFGASVILALWTLVLAIFAPVEAIELMRMVGRIRALGLREGVWVYDVSQWARNFTFGMFYAFSVAFAERFPMSGAPMALSTMRSAVIGGGQYVVLLLLLAELWLLGSYLEPFARTGRKA